MLAEEVQDIDQLICCGCTLCCCLASDCKSHNQVDSAVLGLPVLLRALRILLQHATDVSSEELSYLLQEHDPS